MDNTTEIMYYQPAGSRLFHLKPLTIDMFEMFEKHFLDVVPVWAFFLIVLIFSLLPLEIGQRIGQRRRSLSEHESESAVGNVVGATLALLGFILALTLGAATARFDERKEALIENVNAVENAYRNAALIPAPHNTECRRLLREYVEARIGIDAAYSNSDELANIDARVRAIEAELWPHAEALAKENSSSEIYALFTSSLNDVFNIHNKRVILGGVYRIPVAVWIVLILATLLATFGVGFHFGLSGKRSLMSTMILALTFTLVMTIIFDIDEPGKGFIGVNQAPVRQLYERMKASE